MLTGHGYADQEIWGGRLMSSLFIVAEDVVLPRPSLRLSCSLEEDEVIRKFVGMNEHLLFLLLNCS
jgi:hypothetical protein